MKKLILLFICTLVFSIEIVAQEKRQTERAMPCDQMLARFDNIFTGANSQPEEKKLVVIAYLGKGEKTRVYNQKRLQAVKFYFSDSKRGRGLSAEKIVLAEGNQRNGLPMLEFYINGELYDQFYLSKKGSVCTWCCG